MERNWIRNFCFAFVTSKRDVLSLSWSEVYFGSSFSEAVRIRIRTIIASSSLKSAMQSEILRKSNIEIPLWCWYSVIMCRHTGNGGCRSEKQARRLRTRTNAQKIFAISTNIDKSHNSFSLSLSLVLISAGNDCWNHHKLCLCSARRGKKKSVTGLLRNHVMAGVCRRSSRLSVCWFFFVMISCGNFCHEKWKVLHLHSPTWLSRKQTCKHTK